MFVLVGSPANWNELRQQIVQHGACAVPITGPVPPQFEPIHLLFTHESEVFAQADGQVAQVLAGTQLVVLFDTETRERLGRIQLVRGAADETVPPRLAASPVPAMAGRPASGPLPSIPSRPTTQPTPAVAPTFFAGYGSDNSAEESVPPVETSIENGAAAVSEDDPLAQTTPSVLRGGEEPAWKRYESLSRAEKIHMAKYGNADERRLILRDRDTSLHAFVLSNPGFGAQELAALFRTGQVSGQFVLRVCERRDLYQNPTVAEALVFHPQTPIDLAERLVALLPVEVVRRIAKQGNLRLQIVTAARKRVITR